MTKKPVVLVTGSSRGLGKAMAVAFGKAGYAVGLHYQSAQALAAQTQAELNASQIETLLLQADVRESSQVNAMIQKIKQEWGRVDVLVNNAGITRNKTIETMSDADWTDVVNVNLNGSFFCTRAVLPMMRDQKEGSIINIGSYVAERVVRGGANYAAAKAGLVALTKTTAVEGGPFNIRANVVMPGFHVTDMNRDVWQRFEKNIREQHLLKEMPHPEAMAEFVVHIAQQKTVSGQIFPFESRLS